MLRKFLKIFFLIGSFAFECCLFPQDSIPPIVPVDTFTAARPVNEQFNTVNKNIDVQVRKVPDSSISNLRKDDDYWYANVAPQKKHEKISVPSEDKSIFVQAWFKTLMWIIIITVFAGAIIWYLISGNILIFRRGAKKINQEQDEEISEDIFALNYEKEIQKAIAAKNFRLAVRLMYLQTLKLLSDNELIQYTHERTNSDYLAQLFKTSYYKDFFRLTRNFEYTWYGQFDLSPEAFSLMQKDFDHFKSGLSR